MDAASDIAGNATQVAPLRTIQRGPFLINLPLKLTVECAQGGIWSAQADKTGLDRTRTAPWLASPGGTPKLLESWIDEHLHVAARPARQIGKRTG
jgi:hypothetical protein